MLKVYFFISEISDRNTRREATLFENFFVKSLFYKSIRLPPLDHLTDYSP